MAALRKQFICSVCNEQSDKTVSNYHKQIKKDGVPICGSCASKIRDAKTSERQKSKYSNIIKNNDLVDVICDACGSSRIIKHRIAKMNLLCPSCSAKKSAVDYKDNYESAKLKKLEDSNFGELIRNGILSKTTVFQRQENARKASEYWKNDELKKKQLEFRKTEQYSNVMKEIWNIPGFREKASTRAKEHFKNLWQNDEFRIKMAKIRSNMPKFSSLQVSLNEILRSKNIEFINEYQVGPWTFDCYLPEYDTLIEVQGEYWHSIPKSIANDNAKASYIDKYTNHRLLYLFEREFYGYMVISNKLQQFINNEKSIIEEFEFDEIAIKIEPNDVIRNFLFNYHYLGTVRNGMNICFYFNDILIGVSVISSCVRSETPRKHSIDPKKARELVRFCIHPKYQKKNFASWMLSKSIKIIKSLNKYIRIYSFADPTVGHNGTIYKASNWIFDGYSEKSYYYRDNNGWIIHKKSLYNMAVKMSMTEKEYADLYYYSKIHTLPKMRFYYDLK